MAEPSTNSVSMSVTTALIYGVSGTFFFLLVFLLVMMGLTNCDWHCRTSPGGANTIAANGTGNGMKPPLCRAVSTTPAPGAGRTPRPLVTSTSFLHMEF